MDKLVFILTLVTTCSFGQCVNCNENTGARICWGQDRMETSVHLAKFKDHLKTKLYLENEDYKLEAINELNWLLVNVPCFHKSLYTDAEVLITDLLTIEKKKREIRDYKNKLHDIETLRSKYFGDT